MTFLSALEFADALGVSVRAAQAAFRNAAHGKSWRGHSLPVVKTGCKAGGDGGMHWHLAVGRCSPDLAELIQTNNGETAGNQLASTASLSQLDHQNARLAIISPILETPKGTRARTDRFNAVVSQPHNYMGVMRRFAEDTLRDWVRSYEVHGAPGLCPKTRQDKGKRRVHITRSWDQRIDLGDELKTQVSASLERLGQSMIANDGASVREAIRLCSFELVKLSIAHGSNLPRQTLTKLCKLNTKWAERAGLKRFDLVHRHDADHKAFQDRDVPRIRRKLLATPMDLLVGDVHYMDMQVEECGAPIRVRLIAWMDASSHFVWVTPAFLSKGKGIKQEDVATSLAQVSFSKHGGIPRQYYLDNGTEYSQLKDAMLRLENLSHMEFGVTLAKPYSPTSKGDIEGFFNILERILSGLPGWIGGDRTNKKTENKGKVVQPYRRGLASLETDIQKAVAIYNDRPQHGLLEGRSPVNVLEAKIQQTGFVARRPGPQAFDMIFSRAELRKVRQGMIEFAGLKWYSPDLAKVSGERVELFVPLRADRNRIFVKHRWLGEQGCWIEPEQMYEHGDRAGAKRQAEMQRHVISEVKRLKSEIDPSVSTFEVQTRNIGKIAPNAPAPEVWDTVAIDKTQPEPSVLELEAPNDKQARAHLEEFLAHGGKAKREASGCNR